MSVDVLAPIERDEDYDRTYIPLPGDWEIQTKGHGSTFRLLDGKEGFRLPISPQPYLFDMLERMARDIHAHVKALEGERAAIVELIAAATESRAARKAFEADECIGLLDAVRCADAKLDAALAAVDGEGQG